MRFVLSRAYLRVTARINLFYEYSWICNWQFSLPLTATLIWVIFCVFMESPVSLFCIRNIVHSNSIFPTFCRISWRLFYESRWSTGLWHAKLQSADRNRILLPQVMRLETAQKQAKRRERRTSSWNRWNTSTAAADCAHANATASTARVLTGRSPKRPTSVTAYAFCAASLKPYACSFRRVATAAPRVDNTILSDTTADTLAVILVRFSNCLGFEWLFWI